MAGVQEHFKCVRGNGKRAEQQVNNGKERRKKISRSPQGKLDRLLARMPASLQLLTSMIRHMT